MSSAKGFTKVRVFCLMTALCIMANADIFDKNKQLGKGMNLGNTLEAPTEGAWGEELDTGYFRIIAQKGFQTVRIPIKWSTEERTAIDSPYTVNEIFFARIDTVINSALQNRLNVVIDVHHYDTLFTNPAKEWNRFKAIWQQISVRYQNYSDSLYFEILNEPNSKLTVAKWNQLLSETHQIIRETNTTRPVIIGVAEWGGVGALQKLVLPNDSNIILTIHYYNPFNFTHQGASWVEGSDKYIGTTWRGTYFEKLAIMNDFDYVRSFARKNNLPVFIGEFGSGKVADMESRYLWTSYCARLFESYGFSWAYWAFGTTFNAYSPGKKSWVDTIANALMSTDTAVLAMTADDLGTNLIKNGTLSDSSAWRFGVWGDTGAAATASFDTQGLTVTIANPGSEGWNIQLLQNKIHLEKDHSYVLLFDVSADSERTISAEISQSDSGWTSYGNNYSVMVLPVKRTVSVPFTMIAPGDTNARVCFSFGGDSTIVHLGNVRLYDLGPTTLTVRQHPVVTAALPYTTEVRRKSVVITFSIKPTQPVSIIISALNGRLLYREDNVRIGNANSLKIPFRSTASSSMILQVKSASKNAALNRSAIVHMMN